MNVRNILEGKRTPEVRTIEPERTIQEAIQRLVEHNIGSLVVVDPGGRLVLTSTPCRLRRHELVVIECPAVKAGAAPFKARELGAAAKRFDDAQLARAFRLISEADLALKGSKVPGPRVLERTLLELCR